jgi:hypothetical protein
MSSQTIDITSAKQLILRFYSGSENYFQIYSNFFFKILYIIIYLFKFVSYMFKNFIKNEAKRL